MQAQEQQVQEGFFTKLAAVLLSVGSAMVASEPASAQGGQGGSLVLEEVIVTAQRREESLQEVPISIGVFSGVEIDREGYRNLDDMSRFSPSVSVMDGSQNQVTTIRGFGTGANALNLRSATPTFVDGINFSTTSMVKTAFMDTERVEVLKGPQPLHFGINASGGAFNIESRRPTPEWEGNISVEMGFDRDEKREISVGVGGPLTDTLGIRVAALTEKGDGPLLNRVDGTPFPRFDHTGARVILEWTPTDRLNIMTKFEYSHSRNGGELSSGCLSGAPDSQARRLAGFPFFGPIDGAVVEGADAGNNRSVWDLPPNGVSGSGSLGIVLMDDEHQVGEDCFRGKYGIARQGPFIAPPANVVEEHQRSIFDGSVDIRSATEYWLSNGGDNEGIEGPRGINAWGSDGKDYSDTRIGMLDISYELPNGINIGSETGVVKFDRTFNRENSESPFLFNYNARRNDMWQYSQQIRVESPATGYDLDVGIPGGVNLEFMFGGFWQQATMDLLTASPRANVRRGYRMNKTWEDSKWLSGFWELTFNLLDNQLSISAGGRYTDVTKDNLHQGWGGAWIFDEFPCDSDGADADPASCAQDPDFKRVHTDLTEVTFIDPVTGNGGSATPDYSATRLVRVDSPEVFAPDADTDALWTSNFWNRTTAVPLNWRSGLVPAVGITAPVGSVRNGPFGECARCIEDAHLTADNYDSQVVISYTPNALNGNHTFYGKYTEAFKGPYSQHGQGGISSTLEELAFDPEYATQWEVGFRGTLFDSRVRYNLTGYMLEIKDIQTAGAADRFNPEDRDTVSLNATQKVDGVEMSIQAAVTQSLTLSLAGSIMNARFTDYETGCTEDELVAGAAIHTNNPEYYDNYEDIDLPDSLTDAPGVDESTTPENENAQLAMDNVQEILDNIGPSRVVAALEIESSGQMLDHFYRNNGCQFGVWAISDVLIGGGVTLGSPRTLSRKGQQPALAPDWNFVWGLNYTRPVLDNYEASVHLQGYIADSEFIEHTTFDPAVVFQSGHADMNVSAGIGPMDGTWRVTGYVRSIFQDTLYYEPLGDMELKDHVTSENAGVSRSDFRTYGLRLEWNFL